MSLNASTDLFEDSQNTQEDWRGVKLEELKSSNIHTYPAIRPSHNHTVLFKLPLGNGIPEPYPIKKVDVWELNYVRMPQSPQSLYPVSEFELKPRWDIVKNTLKDINSSKELENAIFSYNSKLSQRWTLDALHTFFSETLEIDESRYFFKSVLPGIIKLALEIEDKFRSGIPLLRKGGNRSISISQEQAAILLANAFLCTFPRRNSSNQNSSFPSINFNKLFQCSLERVQQKLKCFINYFRRIIKKRPTGIITYTRRHVRPNELPVWSEREETLCQLHITSSGTIEDDGAGLMEVDFANKFVGGGVLGRGSVQEEIKFLMCPELVVSRLFTECLDETEALIVTGCERFNKYKGYGDTFTWAGNYVESNLKRDSYNRLNSIVVAIDATYYDSNSEKQFTQESINRELNKAYSGFSFGLEGNIATGNWGCGAFNGDPRLKALLQLMAASVCKKGIAYFTFGDDEIRDDIFKMYTFLKEKNINVGMLWQSITGYVIKTNKNGSSLYEYIYNLMDTSIDEIIPPSMPDHEIIRPSISDHEMSVDDELPQNMDIKEEIDDSTNGEKISKLEPKHVESYSIKTEEGRKRCIETEQQRWDAYEKAMNKFSELESVSKQKKVVPTKRKITDYFIKQ